MLDQPPDICENLDALRLELRWPEAITLAVFFRIPPDAEVRGLNSGRSSVSNCLTEQCSL